MKYVLILVLVIMGCTEEKPYWETTEHQIDWHGRQLRYLSTVQYVLDYCTHDEGCASEVLKCIDGHNSKMRKFDFAGGLIKCTNKKIPVYRCNCHKPPHVAKTYKELRAIAKKNKCNDWKEIEVNE